MEVRNPIIGADMPDPDLLRVGDTYYMVSTTMFYTPGAPILRSKDLCHWEIVSYVFETLEDNGFTVWKTAGMPMEKGSGPPALPGTMDATTPVLSAMIAGKPIFFLRMI